VTKNGYQFPKISQLGTEALASLNSVNTPNQSAQKP